AIVGVASLVPGTAWSAHVGRLELVVDPDHRRRGIGRALTQESIRHGVSDGIAKFVIEALADQLAMFQALGFAAERILREHVRGAQGEPRDLVLLSHFVADNEAGLEATGIAETVRR